MVWLINKSSNLQRGTDNYNINVQDLQIDNMQINAAKALD